jgi:hypothetical protein
MPAANCWSMCWTISTGAGRSGGSPASSLASAAGPPEEAPIASSGEPGCFLMPLMAASLGGLSPISRPIVAI